MARVQTRDMTETAIGERAEGFGEVAAPPGAQRRIAGIDLARALAIVGMVAVHVGPTDVGDLAGRLYALPHGRASVLFVLVAGIGVSLLAASRTRTLASARWRLIWRAVLLLPLGLLLQELDHRVFVILPTYAALFGLAVLLLRLPDRVVLAAACSLMLLGPVVFLIGLGAFPDAFARRAVAWSDPAGRIALGVLAGPYPLPVWAAPFVFGVWLGRRDLRSARARRALVAAGSGIVVLVPLTTALLQAWVGPAAAPPSWRALLLTVPHSQMPPWLIGSIGSALLVLGISLILADALPRLVAPLVALGQLALTFYVAHLLILDAWALRTAEVGAAALTVGGFTVAAALFATAWRRAFARGPLEAWLDVPWRLTMRAVASWRGGERGP